MNTILTDDEIPKLPQKVFLDNAQHHGWGHTDEALKAYADAREAAVLAKLREQEPVAYIAQRATGESCAFESDDPDLALARTDKSAVITPLYAAPLPAVVRVPQKYDDVLVPFLSMMRRELHANSGKGDRPGWLLMDANTALLEVYYHLAKLQKAVRNNDGPGIQEYAADVANMAMMVLDVCGGIEAAPEAPAQMPRGECFTNGNICARCGHDEFIEAPAQGDPLEKLTRIQEELGLYGDKPAQDEQAAEPVRDERAAFEAWWYDTYHAGRVRADSHGVYHNAEVQAAWQAWRDRAAQPSVPAPWREAVKVMREALEEAAQVFDPHDAAFKVITAAIALADSLEGGE